MGKDADVCLYIWVDDHCDLDCLCAAQVEILRELDNAEDTGTGVCVGFRQGLANGTEGKEFGLWVDWAWYGMAWRLGVFERACCFLD